jgi:hypothetical protein
MNILPKEIPLYLKHNKKNYSLSAQATTYIRKGCLLNKQIQILHKTQRLHYWYSTFFIFVQKNCEANVFIKFSTTGFFKFTD